MANGLTISTPEDAAIQLDRVLRAPCREFVGTLIGRGYEADYLEAIYTSDAMRYDRWLRRTHVP